MRFQIRLKGNNRQLKPNEVEIVFRVPPGDIPFNVDLLYNKENDSLEIIFDYALKELKTSNLKKDNVNVEYGTKTGRFYSIAIANFSSWKEKTQLINEIRSNYKHIQTTNNRTRSNFSMGTNLFRQTLTKARNISYLPKPS